MTASIAEQAIINGSTRLYAIIGHPIEQVKSPLVMNPRFAGASRNAVLVPVHIKPDRFEDTVRSLMSLGNLDGLVVTVPYKARILPLLDKILPTGEKVGAVNALRREADGRWIGDMFDGSGLIRGMRQQGIDPRGRRVMLAGAGGAGSAVAVAFADAGAAALRIFDVDTDKAQALAARVAHVFPQCEVTAGPPALDGYDTLVNATPIGMAPDDGPPVPLAALRPDTLVIDIIMKPEVTPLLRQARALGCRALGGRTMLDGQAEEVARFFGIGDA